MSWRRQLAVTCCAIGLAACGGEADHSHDEASADAATEAHADSDHDHEHDDHDHDADGHDDHDDHGEAGQAHVHGEADLAVVLTDAGVELSLLSPLYNLTGFEGEPDTSDKEAAYADMTDLLNATGERFVFDAGAGCEGTRADFPVTSGEAEGDPKPFAYRDLEAAFSFACADAAAVTQIETDLFERFERLELLKVVVFAGPDQDAFEVETPQSTIQLR